MVRLYDKQKPPDKDPKLNDPFYIPNTQGPPGTLSVHENPYKARPGYLEPALPPEEPMPFNAPLPDPPEIINPTPRKDKTGYEELQERFIPHDPRHAPKAFSWDIDPSPQPNMPQWRHFLTPYRIIYVSVRFVDPSATTHSLPCRYMIHQYVRYFSFRHKLWKVKKGYWTYNEAIIILHLSTLAITWVSERQRAEFSSQKQKRTVNRNQQKSGAGK